MLYFQSLRKNRLFFFFVKREKAEFYWSRQRLIFEPKSSLKVVHSTSKSRFFVSHSVLCYLLLEDHFSLLLWVAGFELWSLIFSTPFISWDGFETLTFGPPARSSTTRAKASGPRFEPRLWLTVPPHLNIFFSSVCFENRQTSLSETASLRKTVSAAKISSAGRVSADFVVADRPRAAQALPRRPRPPVSSCAVWRNTERKKKNYYSSISFRSHRILFCAVSSQLNTALIPISST